MKHYWFFIALIAVAFTIPAAAQTLLASQPPAISDVIRALPPDNSSMMLVLTMNDELPLGPRDILEAYKQGMAVTALATCDGLAQIASAYSQGDISDEQAKYASLQTYALGLMQFKMLSTLHDILDSKIEKDAEKDAEPSSQMDRAHATNVPGRTGAAPRKTAR